MIGFITPELLCLLVILNNIFSFSPQEKRDIINLYSDKERILGEYESLRTRGTNRCKEELPKWHRTELHSNTRPEDIGTVVVKVEAGSAVFTLDDIQKIDLPAYIVCTIQGSTPRFMMLIAVDDSKTKSTLAKLIEINPHHKYRKLFLTVEVLNVRLLKEAYIDYLSTMYNRYLEMAQAESNQEFRCHNIEVRHQFANVNSIRRGFFQRGSYTLQLNEHTTVHLPAVLTCEFIYDTDDTEESSEIMYFVLNMRQNFTRVYTNNSSKAHVPANQHFVLEKYLIGE